MSQTYPNTQLEGLPPHTACSLDNDAFLPSALFPISVSPPLGLPSSCKCAAENSSSAALTEANQASLTNKSFKAQQNYLLLSLILRNRLLIKNTRNDITTCRLCK